MGRHIGRITSPITGQEEAVAEIGYHFQHTPENLDRWRRWWRRASLEHFFSFLVTCVVCLVVLSLISYSLFYTPDGSVREGTDFAGDLTFVYGESQLIGEAHGGMTRWLFLLMGAVILFTTELAILDVVSRVAADLVKVTWLRESKTWSESRLYYLFLWGEILLATALLVYFRADAARGSLAAFVIVSSLNGGIMGVYSATLLWLNCRYLPRPLRMSWPRVVVMCWSVLFFGTFGVWALWNVLRGYDWW